jgi:hypothetical protein
MSRFTSILSYNEVNRQTRRKIKRVYNAQSHLQRGKQMILNNSGKDNAQFTLFILTIPIGEQFFLYPT